MKICLFRNWFSTKNICIYFRTKSSHCLSIGLFNMCSRNRRNQGNGIEQERHFELALKNMGQNEVSHNLNLFNRFQARNQSRLILFQFKQQDNIISFKLSGGTLQALLWIPGLDTGLTWYLPVLIQCNASRVRIIPIMIRAQTASIMARLIFWRSRLNRGYEFKQTNHFGYWISPCRLRNALYGKLLAKDITENYDFSMIPLLKIRDILRGTSSAFKQRDGKMKVVWEHNEIF